MITFFEYIICKPVKVVVLATFLYACKSLSWKNFNHKCLLLSLAICLGTEIINTILFFSEIKRISFVSTIGTILYTIVWLTLLSKYVVFKKLYRILFGVYMASILTNLILVDGVSSFSSYTFVTGAFIYIFIFIYESFYQLRRENFQYFINNNYILILAPVMLFLGFSFYFGFKDRTLGEIPILNVKLYDIVANFVNIVYYSITNIYIYRENKLKRAR